MKSNGQNMREESEKTKNPKPTMTGMSRLEKKKAACTVKYEGNGLQGKFRSKLE